MSDIQEYRDQGGNLPVTRQDLESLKQQRELLREFVSSQMREANFKDYNAKDFGEGDYGVIPGTKKKSLLKPGAEKLLRLFSLGVRVRLADKEFDRHANFAVYTYRAEVYPLRNPGVVVAECEGTANSQEVKYKERSVWREVGRDRNNKPIKEQTKEETPITDILNTLMKMAQKRAIIGATIMATAASDYFTQDMEEKFDRPKVQPNDDQKSEPKDVPNESVTAPECCGKAMMVSKYANRETGEYDWYCLKCKTSQPRAA